MRALWPMAPGLGLLALGFAFQQVLPAPLKPHVDALTAAKSLSAKVTVTPLGGAPAKYSFSFARSGSFKIEGADSSIFFDGKNLTEYSALSKTYKVTPAETADWKKIVSDTKFYAWSSFFSPTLLGDLGVATKGRTRTVAGEQLSELTVRFNKVPTKFVTFMQDSKGIVKGYTFKDGDKETLVVAQDLTLGTEDPDASLFAFVPPAGATLAKIEDTASSGAKYADVQAIFDRSCMPCHNSQNRRSGYDLSSYDSVMGNPMGVRVSSPNDSMILKAVKGDGARLMPQGRQRLSQAQIDTIANWIKAGAKKD